MGIVNQLKMSSNVVTVKDLALSFCSRIRGMVKEVTVIVLIFDSYSQTHENIKALTWTVRNKKHVRYQLSEKTHIKNVKLKEFAITSRKQEDTYYHFRQNLLQ